MRALGVAAVRTRDDPAAQQELDRAMESLNRTRRMLQARYDGEDYEDLEHF